MGLGQRRTPQDSDFYSGDSYTKLFDLIQNKVNQWHPFAKRPIDILTVVTPSQLNATLKRVGDITHNGFPYRWIRPIQGVLGANDRMVVLNDPEGPFILGTLAGDTLAQTISFSPVSTYISSYQIYAPSSAGMGTMQITIGATLPAASVKIGSFSFSTPFIAVPSIHVNSADPARLFYAANWTTTGFNLYSCGGMAANTTYYIMYLCVA